MPHDASGNFLPGFFPEDWDRVAVQGPWIVDCGHDDFHTEIHPATVMAVASQEGSTTVSHVFYSPYEVSQQFNPDPAEATDFSKPGRFHDANTSTFPLYVYRLLAGMAGVGAPEFQGADRLESHSLINAVRQPDPVTWYVCAPGKAPSSGKLSVSADFTTRSGVEISVTPRDDVGCAEITATIGSKYTPMPLERKDCELDWDILNQQAQAALMLPGLDVRKAIDALVPASIVDKVNQNPLVDCYDPLVAPALTSGQGIKVSDDQPFPFYGQVNVSWKA
jgi:hypothetical protein